MNNDKVQLVARKKLRYAKRSLVPGDAFEAKPRDARLLIAMGQAAPPPKLVKATKRTYKTRDLEAESASTDEPKTEKHEYPGF